MSSTNQGPEYFAAEKRYLVAQTTEDQMFWLKEMIRNFKKHKGSEGMLSNIKQRLKKLEEKQEKSKKVGKSSHKGVKKEGYQVVLVGLPNSGKSSLLSKLTNAQPRVSQNPFTTKEPEVGTLIHEGIKAQIVDLPSIGSENFDVGIVHTADCLLIVLENLSDLQKISPFLSRATNKQIIALNKSDLLNSEELRKLQNTLQSKRINGLVVSCYNNYNITPLKDMIIKGMNVLRIYTKEPGKSPTNIPVVLPQGSTVKDVAESILKGFSLKVKETRLTGPSSKFPNQKVGLSHVVKDKDIVEFHTK